MKMLLSVAQASHWWMAAAWNSGTAPPRIHALP